jgi:leucyl/phenylalanyl-tRNA--protein transferase
MVEAAPPNVGGVGEILRCYLSGFYPYWDEDVGKFYWDCNPRRTYVHLNAKTEKKARSLLKSVSQRFDVTEEKHVEEVLAALSNEKIKPNTWVQGPVIDVYRILHAHGYLVSLEVQHNGRLAGAVLGLRLPGVLILETMFSYEAESSASKAALAHAVIKYMGRGCRILDVQIEHKEDHPVARLGEVTRSIRTYVKLVRCLTRAADEGRFAWRLEAYRLHDFDVSAQRLENLMPDRWRRWRDSFEGMKRDKLIEEINSTTISLASPKVDPRQKKSFPANVDDWRTAVPELTKSSRGVSLDILGFQVMQSWETPLMKAMARGACRENDLTLEIGYGLGICSEELHIIQPRLHVIVECNKWVADTARRTHRCQIAAGRLVVVEGFWEDLCKTGMLAPGNLMPHLGIDAFDSIIFDAYPLRVEQLRQNELLFFKDACRLLANGGRFTYFSNEKRTIGRNHQRAIQDAFTDAVVCFSRVSVTPWSDCEYWSASEILNIVITKTTR